MAFLDSIVNLNPPYQQNTGGAYASLFSPYEIQTPQYPVPNAYTLAQQGYRQNELIYQCIHKWEIAISQAPCLVRKEDADTTDAPRKRKTPIELPDHPARNLLKHPNEFFGEDVLWRTTETFLKVAGFAAWEIEENNFGEPINLYPMRPDWCSFRRGVGKLLDKIRYQPYGLPFADIPIERVLLFQYFDPIYPMLKALSPSAVANRTAAVDNAITNFLKTFFDRGAVINGLLITEQSLNDAEAKRIRDRWQQAHGGYGNWSDVAVLGAGTKYQEMGKDFRSMQFSEIDEREEERICQCFHIDPILVGGRVAAGSSTYNNKKEAHAGWHREEVYPEWRFLQGEATRQLARYYDDLSADDTYLEFDTNNIYALQEDKTAAWARATEAAKINGITRDEFREEIGYDPIDNDNIFIGATVRETLNTNPSIVGAEDNPNGANDTSTEAPGPTPKADANGKEADTNAAAKELEKKQFRAFAAKRKREGHPERAGEFKFRYLSESERRVLLEAQPDVKSGTPFRQVAYP